MDSSVDSLLHELDVIEERRRRRRADKWTEEENQHFIACIKKQFQSKEYLTENINDFIDWYLVAEQLNRTHTKCRSHWFRNIRIKLISEQNSQSIDCWHQFYDTSRLISQIYHNNYDSEEDIDWDFLKEKFAKIISYNKLLRIWRNLKTSVPESDSKTFKELIDWLYRNKTSDEIVLSDDEY